MSKYDIPRIAYRKSEAAKMLGPCLRTIDNMIAYKQLLARKIGRSVIIPATALYAVVGSPLPEALKITRIALTKAEAAYAIGLSVRTIDNLIAAGELNSQKVRGRILIPVPSLYALLRGNHKTVKAAA
jgi:hypothetical protein